MRKNFKLLLLILALFAARISQAQGTFVTFDAPAAGTAIYQGTYAYSLNDSGYAVGFYIDANALYHGFIRDPSGAITAIDNPAALGSAGTVVSAINSKNELTGSFFGSYAYSFVLPKSGEYTNFSSPSVGSYYGTGATSATAINTGGTVTGRYTDKNWAYHGFIRSPTGVITEFSAPTASNLFDSGTSPNAINAGGTIVGWELDQDGFYHAFMRLPTGALTTFGLPGKGTLATSISQKNIVTGFYYDQNNVSHGFIRAQNGRFTTFEASGAGIAYGEGTTPASINKQGVITGSFIDASGAYHGFVRQSNGSIITLDAPGAGSGTGQGTQAFSINSTGSVAGLYVDGGNLYHSFIWTP